jgi:hypothetical protein
MPISTGWRGCCAEFSAWQVLLAPAPASGASQTGSVGAPEGILNEQVADSAVAGDRRRRRRSTASSRWRAEQLELRLRLLMGLVLILYLAVGLGRVWSQSNSYGGVALGMGPAAVRLAKGAPAREEPAPQRWIYEEGGTVHTVTFAGGAVAESNCRLAVPDLIACPAAFGISAGSSEHDLLRRLGPADRTQLGAEGKELFYDGLGYAFTLHGETVVGIAHTPSNSLTQLVRDMLWQLLP